MPVYDEPAARAFNLAALGTPSWPAALPAQLTEFRPDSSAFALAVARLQAALGLSKDGKLDPVTVAAIAASPDILGVSDHEEYEGLLEREPTTKTAAEWGLGAVTPVLKLGDQGQRVLEYQKWLEALGYELARFGADGDFGDETLDATRDFQDDHDMAVTGDALRIRGVAPLTYDLAKQLYEARPDAPPPIVIGGSIPIIKLENDVYLYDVTSKHAGLKRKGRRSWGDIKGITLHQTATLLGEDPLRWSNVGAHIAATVKGRVVLMNDPTWLVYHGHGLSRRDVGVEVDGFFAGVEGDLKTFWKPKSKPDRKPMTIGDLQIRAALAAMAWIIETVASHGGKIEYLHAHRQANKSRISDPGSRIWQKVGLVAKARWGLVDGGPHFSLGGYPIPKQWDPTYTESYRGW